MIAITVIMSVTIVPILLLLWWFMSTLKMQRRHQRVGACSFDELIDRQPGASDQLQVEIFCRTKTGSVPVLPDCSIAGSSSDEFIALYVSETVVGFLKSQHFHANVIVLFSGK